MLDSLGVVVAVDVRHGQTIVEEGQMELAFLQSARNALIIFRRREVRRVSFVAP